MPDSENQQSLTPRPSGVVYQLPTAVSAVHVGQTRQ